MGGVATGAEGRCEVSDYILDGWEQWHRQPMTPADLAAVVADWCEDHGVGRVDLAIALLGFPHLGPGSAVSAACVILGADPDKSVRTFTRPDLRINGGAECYDQKHMVEARAEMPDHILHELSIERDALHPYLYARAAALAVAAMRCDLEGR